jgi:hypothetical protein
VEVPPVLEREMGCTLEELTRWLPGAAGDAPTAATDGGWRITLPGGEVLLEAAPRPPRRIALLSLPVLHVRFRFLGLDPEARAAFLARFDAWTRRGGG